MKIVTPADMKRVDIKKGWLIKQFVQFTFGNQAVYNDGNLFSDGDPVSCDVETGVISIGSAAFFLNPTLVMALTEYDALVVQKNEQYKDAWQKDGPITALCDLKDKLYRLDSASESGAIMKWDRNKLYGTFFDIWVRDMMCLAWFGLNFVDDDDDRHDH
jgi:hypothetical protein